MAIPSAANLILHLTKELHRKAISLVPPCHPPVQVLHRSLWWMFLLISLGFIPLSRHLGPTNRAFPKAALVALLVLQFLFAWKAPLTAARCSRWRIANTKWNTEMLWDWGRGQGKGMCWLRKYTGTEPFPTTPPLPAPQTAWIINYSLQEHLHISRKPREPE